MSDRKVFNWNAQVAPVSREILDDGTPFVRVIGGILFLGYSWVSTAVLLAWLVAPKAIAALLSAPSAEVAGQVALPALIGFAFAVGVSVVEFVTVNRAPWAYRATLWLLDVPFTAALTFVAILTLLRQHTNEVPMTWMIVAITASIAWGYATSRFGELLIFGSRKPTPGAQKGA